MKVIAGIRTKLLLRRVGISSKYTSPFSSFSTSCDAKDIINKGVTSPLHCFLKAVSSPSRAEKIAIVDPHRKQSFTYGELCSSSIRLARVIENEHNKKNKPSCTDAIRCIASYNRPGVNYVITALAAWHLGATLVPLCVAHTKSEISYFIADSGSEIVVYEPECAEGIQHLEVPGLCIDENDPSLKNPREDDSVPTSVHLNSPDPSDNALILYTSGTSGAPKGCVHTYGGLMHMISSLVEAWKYTEEDKIFHFLPLHHMHGVLNKLLCPLQVGGEIEFLPSASAQNIWRRLAQAKSSANPPTLFMAVPTIYAKMLDAAAAATDANAEQSGDITKQELEDALNVVHRMRVMISGSAALPDPIMDGWKELTGHVLLERYGMTEIGMGISNPLHGDRRTGSVGLPLPHVECRLVDDNEAELLGVGEMGELRIKGPTVFKSYLNKEEETRKAFDEAGWFKTGDVAVREHSNADPGDVRFRILGRQSSDIIKSGGYKLSALEIERELLAHPLVAETVVVGTPDDVYGEIVTAIIVIRKTSDMDSGDVLARNIEEFLQSRLAKYKQPRKFHFVEKLPRNLMGKVNKKTIFKELKL